MHRAAGRARHRGDDGSVAGGDIPGGARVIPSDATEKGRSAEEAIHPGETRWAIYDRPSRTLWFGGARTKTHLTVAEESGLLRNSSDYYRPGPAAKMCGGYLIRSPDGAFSFDGFSGTFPGTPEAVSEARDALVEYCRSIRESLSGEQGEPT